MTTEQTQHARDSAELRHMVPDGWNVERVCSPSGYVLHSPGGSMIRVCDSGMGGIETAFAMFLKALLAAGKGGEAVEVVAVAFITRAEKDGPKIAITLKKEDAEKQHKNWLSMSKIITTEPLMTVGQHQRILAASVGSAEAVAWRVTGRDGLTVTAQYPEWAESDRLLTITPLYARFNQRASAGGVNERADPIVGVLKNCLAEGVQPTFSGGDLKHLISLLEARAAPSTNSEVTK